MATASSSAPQSLFWRARRSRLPKHARGTRAKGRTVPGSPREARSPSARPAGRHCASQARERRPEHPGPPASRRTRPRSPRGFAAPVPHIRAVRPPRRTARRSAVAGQRSPPTPGRGAHGETNRRRRDRPARRSRRHADRASASLRPRAVARHGQTGAVDELRGCLLERRCGTVALAAVDDGGTGPLSYVLDPHRRNDGHQHQVAAAHGREIDAERPRIGPLLGRDLADKDASEQGGSHWAVLSLRPTRIPLRCRASRESRSVAGYLDRSRRCGSRSG